MAEIHDLDTTDANNTARFPEGMAPSSFNNAARALEGIIARYFFDYNTSVAATLSGSLITMTANRTSLTLTGTTSNYVANTMQAFTMGSVTNTGPVRVNINGIGAKELRNNLGASLSSSVLLSGTRALIAKDGTNDYFRLLYPFTDPSFTEASQAQQEAGSASNVVVTPAVQQYHQSSAKMWANINGSATASARASYNVASITDNGVGDLKAVLTNNMSSVNYAILMGCIPINTDFGQLARDWWVASGATTGPTVKSAVLDGNAVRSQEDQTAIMLSIYGDLA